MYNHPSNYKNYNMNNLTCKHNIANIIIRYNLTNSNLK